MKLKTILLIIGLTMFLTSCTTLSEFIIVNESNSEIEIEYKVKDMNLMESVRTTSPDKLGGMNQDWKPIAEDRLQVDKASGIVNVKLPVNRAVVIESKVDYGGHDEGSINIESIKIKGGSGERNFVGKEAQTQFKKQENNSYVMFYK